MLIIAKVFPQNKKNEVIFLFFDSEKDSLHLKIKISQSPEKGKANEAVIKLLSRLWKIAKSDIELIQGTTSRNKIFHLKEKHENLTKFIKNEGIL